MLRLINHWKSKNLSNFGNCRKIFLVIQTSTLSLDGVHWLMSISFGTWKTKRKDQHFQNDILWTSEKKSTISMMSKLPSYLVFLLKPASFSIFWVKNVMQRDMSIWYFSHLSMWWSVWWSMIRFRFDHIIFQHNLVFKSFVNAMIRWWK